MHTPGHAVINLAALGSCTNQTLATPILIGAVLPDLPILFLYVRERYLHRLPAERIWADHYQRPFWQNLIHGMHSIPIALSGMVATLAYGPPELAAFFASVLVHALSDLPVHAEDAHRHFLPFSHYRWKSPISYWDVRHHAAYVAFAEVLLVWAATWMLWRSSVAPIARLALAGVNLWYVLNYWRNFVRRAPHHHPDPGS